MSLRYFQAQSRVCPRVGTWEVLVKGMKTALHLFLVYSFNTYLLSAFSVPGSRYKVMKQSWLRRQTFRQLEYNTILREYGV